MSEVPLYGKCGKDHAPGAHAWVVSVSIHGGGDNRGTSLIRNRLPVGPYCKAMPRALWWS